MSRQEDLRRWNSILSNRARSLSPRRNSSKSTSHSPPPSKGPRRRLLAPAESVQSSMGSLVKSWIMTPTMATVQTSTKVLLPKTPALTLLMIKLEETIPLYCQKLAFPTMENAAWAAGLLDNRITATSASSPSNSVSSSPSSPRSLSMSQQALQSCWETYISPFLLLAAAEALYTQERTPKLLALYVKISDDLIVVEQILCDPVTSESGHYPKAASLAQQLLALRKWTAMRCRLLELILQGAPLPHVRSDFQELLDGVRSSTLDGDFMMQSLRTEVQLWSWLSEACWHLQDYRYVSQSCIFFACFCFGIEYCEARSQIPMTVSQIIDAKSSCAWRTKSTCCD
jgi:hypothetical protein